MILTAWEHANDRLKTETQEEYTCCGVNPGGQEVFSTPEGHPSCNSTKVRKHHCQFLPRDAVHKRGLCRRAMSVRLSVRLSVPFMYSVKTNKHIFNIFHLRVATLF